MKKKLQPKELITVASMLFGLFFGAGNLIFPVSMGQMAGSHVWQASAGFLVTGVGLPLLGVAALGISREEGLLELSSRTGKYYGLFFTGLLYLTIGPFFAIPRCATVSYEVGIQGIFSGGVPEWALFLFSLLFFAAVLLLSLRPGEILTWVGKVLNPLFLCFLGVLLVRVFLSPMGVISEISAEGAYVSGAFATGLLEGYNTMDALAGLAFGIIVVNAIRGLGVEEADAIARNTVRAGIFSSAMMAVIYLLVAAAGTQSRGLYETSENGGAALAVIAQHYFGSAGAVILAATVTIACLKTAVGLITSCAETFEKMVPVRIGYKAWAVFFCGLSFLIANTGLETIIRYSLPVLMFLYPLSITLIALTLTGRLFDNDSIVYKWTLGCTAAAAAVDFINALPEGTAELLHLAKIAEGAAHILPLSEAGFGWICPAVFGAAAGLAIRKIKKVK